MDKDKQEKVRKKVFTKWTNYYLAQHHPPMRVDDLVEDFKDGSKFIALVEQLSGERFHEPEVGVKRFRRPDVSSNVNKVLQYLEKKGVKVNINAADIIKGQSSPTLDLIWSIILHFQMEEKTSLLEKPIEGIKACASSFGLTKNPISKGLKSPLKLASAAPVAAIKLVSLDMLMESGRKSLLEWAKNSTSRRFGVTVTDFGSSWRDGWAFLAIIYRIRPDLVSMDKFRNATNAERLEAAFKIAESELGIARLLDPEDVDIPHPDEKSVMTYVAQFMHSYPEVPAEQENTAVETPKGDLEIITAWLDKAESILGNRKQLSLDFKTQYSGFFSLKSEFKVNLVIWERLELKLNSDVDDVDLKAAWPNLQQRWSKIAKDLPDWQIHLDSTMPGSIGLLGKWIIEAERRLALSHLPNALNTDMLQGVKQELSEHEIFFKPLEAHIKFIQGYTLLPESANVSADHVKDLQNRLDDISKQSHKRLLKLRFEIPRYELLGLFSRVEDRLKKWSEKYGTEKEVSALLEQHKIFVEEKQIFKEYGKHYASIKSAVDACQKAEALDTKEIGEIGVFLSERDDLWKKKMEDLHSVGNSANQVLISWGNYSTNLRLLMAWFSKVEEAINKDTADQLEFFNDINQMMEKKKIVLQSGEYLASECREEISNEIKTKITNFEVEWEKTHLHIRLVFEKHLKQMQQWLQNGEILLSTKVLCKHDNLLSYSQQLKKLQVELDQYDTQFEKLSKQMHEAVAHFSANEAEKITAAIKKEKERLQKIKTNLMNEIQMVNQLIPLLLSFENGYPEIEKWLNEADGILESGNIPKNAGEIPIFQKNHKAFFSRASTYKSQLANQMNINKSIIEYAAGSQTICTQEVKDKMSNLSERFQTCLNFSAEWESALEKAALNWGAYHKNLKLFKEKFPSAKTMLEKIPTVEEQLPALRTRGWIHCF